MNPPDCRLTWPPVLRHAELPAGHHGDAHPVQRAQTPPPAQLLFHRHGAGRAGRYLPQHHEFRQGPKFGGGMGLYFERSARSDRPSAVLTVWPAALSGGSNWPTTPPSRSTSWACARAPSPAISKSGTRISPSFLQLRTNNGDDRSESPRYFPAVCYPDLFWRTVRDDLGRQAPAPLCAPMKFIRSRVITWRTAGDEWEQRATDCVADPSIGKRTVPIKELVRLILKSCVETELFTLQLMPSTAPIPTNTAASFTAPTSAPRSARICRRWNRYP